MPEFYDNWERLVDAVRRKEKDRELCYLSSIPSSDSSSDSSCPASPPLDIPTLGFSDPVAVAGTGVGSSSSPHQLHHQAFIAASVLPRMREVVLAVNLEHGKLMKGVLRAVNMISRFGLCFSTDLRYFVPIGLIIKAVASLPGVASIAHDRQQKKLIVTGDIDPILLTRKLRKLYHAELVSVGPAKDLTNNSEQY